jgi:hypothetical protein
MPDLTTSVLPSYTSPSHADTLSRQSGDPLSTEIDLNLLSGCALGIADVDNINDVTMDNLAIFSVQHECIKQKVTSFDIPARMPPCTGEKCICVSSSLLFGFRFPSDAVTFYRAGSGLRTTAQQTST